MGRYYGLDAVRAIASACVVLYHFGQHSGIDILPKAWISVDVFMCMSGVVLCLAYKDFILKSESVGGFVKIRFKRLYIPYYMALAIGAIAYYLSGQHNLTLYLSLAVLLMPYIGEEKNKSGVSYDNVFYPINGPSWSLFFEVVSNFIFYFIIKSKINIVYVLIISFVGWLIFGRFFDHIGGGWGGGGYGLLTGFFRTLFSFLLGVCLIYNYKYWADRIKIKFGIFLLIFLFYACFPNVSGTSIVDIFFISTISPALVFSAYSAKMSSSQEAVAKYFGESSYHLYISHMPVFYMMWELFDGKFFNSVYGYVAICFFASFFVARFLYFVEKKIKLFIN